MTTQGGARIRVLVVDDSPSRRGWLLALLDSDPQLEVAGWADNGAAAIRAVARLRPDVITMDLHMPGMDGLEATRRIMQATPTPVVLVTAEPGSDQARLLAEALRAGVLAVELQPSLAPDSGRELLETIKGMARVRVLRRVAPSTAPGRALAPGDAAVRHAIELIAIGASTGGPQVLLEILQQLPPACTVPVLIVQHMSEGFVPSLVKWLQPHCALPIHVALDGRRLDAPGIHIAPTGKHLIVRGHTLRLTDDPPVDGHRPSVTVLFRSIAHAYGPAAVGVLLSGMGQDGAAGLADLKRAGGVTMAQNAESSTIFGMPAAAIDLGVVDYTLPPVQIAHLLQKMVRPKDARSGAWTG